MSLTAHSLLAENTHFQNPPLRRRILPANTLSDGDRLPLRSRRPPMEGSSACASLGRRNQEPGGIPCTESDVEYFKAYDDIAVHEEMIKDRARTETYIAAIRKFQPVIEGKVVLDVGCGTGILAILCAYAGASRVYAVDASEIAIQADEIVKVNKLSGKVIVLHGRIEDVLIEEKVDVIISEWMGYMLLHESMLSSIIFARNKWFKKGGLILPSHAMLFMAPFTHSGRYLERIDFWKDVHGIDMSPMLTLAKQCAFLEPCVETIPRSNLLSWPTTVMEVNCHTVTLQELEHVTGKFRFISTSKAPLHGFAFWFNVIFDAGESPNPNARSPFIPEPNPGDPIVLYTAPGHNPTHWNQTLVYLFEPIELEQSQIIEGTVTLTQNMPYPRSWNISIAFSTGKQSFIVQSLMR